jgi:hypothetical protein
MKPHEILWELSAADAERLENAWWLTTANETGKNQLRHRRKAKPVNVSEFMAKRP